MTDLMPNSDRSANMAAIKSRDTKPELIVRRLVHSMGYRYRLHYKDLPGKPDLVFGPRRKVIFVHGCFWHQHSDPNCLDGRMPGSNLSYWRPKLEGNKARDAKRLRQLEELGWCVLTVWECETGNSDKLRKKLNDFL